jgi:hypothetical protein
MPGPVSDSPTGKRDWTPYVPSWCYPNNAPKMCPCGHHEGYHAGVGARCIHANAHDKCGCAGLPAECFTTDAELYAENSNAD